MNKARNKPNKRAERLRASPFNNSPDKIISNHAVTTLLSVGKIKGLVKRPVSSQISAIATRLPICHSLSVCRRGEAGCGMKDEATISGATSVWLGWLFQKTEDRP